MIVTMDKKELREHIKQIKSKWMDLSIVDKELIALCRLELRSLINEKKKDIGLQSIALTETKNTRMLELRNQASEDKTTKLKKNWEVEEKTSTKKRYTEEEAKAIISMETLPLQKKLIEEEFARDELYKFDSYLESIWFLACDIIKQDDLYSKNS